MRIFLAGPGQVGTAFLSQLDALQRQGGGAAGLVLAGIAGSRRMAVDPSGIDPEDWRGRFDAGLPADLGAFSLAAKDAARRDAAKGGAVFVDTSASPAVADLYGGLLSAGVSVVTASKIAASRSMGEWRALRAAEREGGSVFLNGANVCAGLPVLRTVADLVATQDRITRIEAVLSGTISFVFNGLSAESPFSERVREARSLGYAEPDPRVDLSALDAARKALILARTAGMELEPGELRVEGLLPPGCPAEGAMETGEFFKALARGDGAFEARRLEAERAGKVLRHVATIDRATGEVSVAVAAVGLDHPLARLRGADNLVAIWSRRYAERPIVIQGPGAGAEVTAAGVLRDTLVAAGFGGRLA